MGDNRTGLPEGTDKIIGGASADTTRTATGAGTAGAGGAPSTGAGTAGAGSTGGTGSTGGIGGGGSAGSTGGSQTATTGTTMATGQEPSAPGGASGSGTAGAGPESGASEGGGGVIDKIRSGGEKLSGQAADKARDLVTQGLERSAEALGNVGRLIGETAPGLDERLGPEFGDYARRAASSIESTANSLASKDPDELIDDTRNLVRKSPTVAVAGAAIVGFALARLIKTGFEGAREAARGQNGSERTGGTGGSTET